jgi:hypothetical protein
VPVVVVLYGITLIPGVRGPGPHFVGDLVYYGFLAHDSAPPYLVIHRPAAAEQVTATLRAGLAPPEAVSAL